MFIICGVTIGMLLSVQTAINAKLRVYTQSPIASAFISCMTSYLLLIVMLLIGNGVLGFRAPDFSKVSAWMFMGGFLGVVVLIGCIILFPVLGAIQTTVLPIFGQILMGVLTDCFGWFNAGKRPLSVLAMVGLGFLVVGIVFVVILPEKRTILKNNTGSRKKWQIIGVLIGMASAMQASVNGRLGSATGSALAASCINSTIVCTIILIICLYKHNFGNVIYAFSKKTPKWVFLGGVFGAAFVLANTMIIPVIGARMLMILSVTGQLLCSVLVEQFGWFSTCRKRIKSVQIMGLALMMLGIVLVKVL